MASNNTNFSLQLKQKVDKINAEYKPQYIQYFQYVTERVLIESDLRGLLVYYEMGFGKSILAAAIAEHYRKKDPNRRIIILLPKSLQTNFEINVKKYIKQNSSKDDPDSALDSYKFISLNASNMFTQLQNIKKSQEELNLEKQLGDFHVATEKLLENSLLIIDEFHNLSNSIINGAKNAVRLYNTIMSTKNIKLVFLTGTPIRNHPFELVPTFNMLKGPVFEAKRKFTLFPENQKEFEQFFVENRQKIKNKERFQNRIFGMVSYYGNVYSGKDGRKDFPEQKSIIVERITMSLYQFVKYQEARETERKEEANKFKANTSSDGFGKGNSKESYSSYRIRSRQISNFLVPDYAVIKSKNTTKKTITKIKEEDLKDLDKYSPKFKVLLSNLKKHDGQLGYIYSNFVSGEGIAILARVLDVHGFIFWEKSDHFIGRFGKDYVLKKNGIDITPTTQHFNKERTYAIITGDIPFSDRQDIVTTFNSKENSDGKLITILLISRSGAEGLSLKRSRHCHILEPFFNYAIIEQVLTRGVRFMSHSDLPEAERNVQPYVYLSTYPKSYDKKLIVERTTDEELWVSALNGKKLRDDFEIAMIEASIDCSLHFNKSENKNLGEKLKCYLCAPTNEKLYDLDLYSEMRHGNTCKNLKSSSGVKVHEIKIMVDGSERNYYYSKEGDEIRVFTFSDELGGYIPLPKSSPIYADIVKQVLFG